MLKYTPYYFALAKERRPTKLTLDRTMEIDNETTAKETQIKLQGMGKVLFNCTILTAPRLDILWNSLYEMSKKTSGLSHIGMITLMM